MTPLRSVLLFAILASTTASGAEAEGGNKAVPLFASNDVVEVTISAPFRQIMRDRSSSDEMQGTLVYQDPEAGETTLDIGIRTRGRYRRQSDKCKFAPLRLNFRKTKGT